MKVPANLSGDQLILDYLARVAEAGLRRLPKGARMAFVGRTRALIEQECGQAGRADPARVMEVLTGLGEPEELVRAERARIDAEWAMSRSRRHRSGETAAATGEHQPAPQGKGQAARRGEPPASFSRTPPAGSSRTPPAGSSRTPPPRPWGPPEAEADTQPLPRIPVPWWAGGQEGSGADDAPGPGVSGPFRSPVNRPSAVAGAAGRLARLHPLESAAVALLGLGGVILPFPFWLFGAMATIPSRLFDIKDKWIAFMGPVVIAFIGTTVVALVIRGHGNPAVIYFHALGLDIGLLLRLGSVICAAYLSWRVHRGPRVRVPPWRR